ncbi:TetR/AcrR family transcriptional regulator [Sorangium sp. So ce854]|uniref:TetR/AcrR family transcriptional regulator n=1 Tax=Sorangium sp. So ce854 TaxID=3133322 RepID=UPI003F5FC92D
MSKPSARRRRSYHHGDLPSALLDAADALVAEKGASGFSLREAARVVGVDPAACYRHFRDREAILQALARRGFTRLAAAMAAAAAELPEAPPERVLLAIGHAYVRFAAAHPSAFRVMFGPTGVDARDHLLRGDYPDDVGPYERMQRALGAWLADARCDADLEQASLTLWAGVHGLACLLLEGALRLPDDERRDRLVAASIATTLAGIRAAGAGIRAAGA